MKGTQVGSYIIDEKIGEGGMGVVYSAKHARMNRMAVVKVLRKHLIESPEMARRFENEANAAASIGHPGIVQVFDIGQQQDGSLYIVMELLAGESLQDRLDRLGKLTVRQATRIVNQCADALGAAHATGITHRDLKPDNIFLVPDSLVPGGERAKLLDFGIAKLQVEGMATMGTAMGTLMGTPPYMSPEQCQGAGGVQNASDLYSLGCILFQLVTGRTPFLGKGPGDYIVAHTTKPPPLLRSLAPEAPDALQEIVSMLLAKKPEDRFASCAALCAALGSIKGGDGPTTVGPAAMPTGPVVPAAVPTGPVLPTGPVQHAAVPSGPTVPAAFATGGDDPRMAATNFSNAGHSHGPGAGVAREAAQSFGQGHPAGLPGTTLGLSAGENVTAPGGHRGSADAGFPKPGGSKGKVAAIGALLTLALAGVGYAILSADAGKSKSAVDVQGTADAQAVRSEGHESSTETTNLSSDETGAIELESSGAEIEMRRAQVRLDAWHGSRVKTRFSLAGENFSSAGNFETADGKTKLTMRYEGTRVACEVTFGDNGNPSELTSCHAIGEKFSIKPQRFECYRAKKRLVCKASRISLRVDNESVRATFQVSRPLDDADAVEGSTEVKVESPDVTLSKPPTQEAPVTKPSSESTNRLAEQRRSAWVGAPVGTRFQMDGEAMSATGRFRVARGKTKIIMRLAGQRVACEIKFGANGNPATFVNCAAKGEALRMKPKAFHCSVSKDQLVCASNFTARVDGITARGSFQVHRPVIAADRRGDL